MFPLLPVLLILGPGLFLLLFVSTIGVILMFLINVLHVTPPGISIDAVNQNQIFQLIAFGGSLITLYFCYWFKGGLLGRLLDNYVAIVVRLLKKLNPVSINS